MGKGTQVCSALLYPLFPTRYNCNTTWGAQKPRAARSGPVCACSEPRPPRPSGVRPAHEAYACSVRRRAAGVAASRQLRDAADV
jgi:hypothetical protein